MSDQNKLAEKLPHNLRVSITNLWDQLGQSQNILIGLLVNLSLAMTGVAIYLLTSGLVAYAGAVWAIINLIGIVKWVFGL